jgi:hypothetical protein
MTMLRDRIRKTLLPFVAGKKARSFLRFVEACKYMDWRVWDREGGNQTIYDSLAAGKPQAIGRFGSTELQAIRNYLRYRHLPDWQEQTAIYRRTLYTHSGVFPDSPEVYQRFCEYMLEEVLPEVDVMAVWFNTNESNIVRKYSPNARVIPLVSLESYSFQRNRWTRFLEGKKVLVIHPFVNTIRFQFPRRHEIWGGQTDILPDCDLLQIAAPHYPALVPPIHGDWFYALNDMKQQMAHTDYDVALIGAGAYSLPLAVHAKKMGKVGIHLGGALQVYFGIKGRRWEHNPVFTKFFNEYWIRPLPEDTPEGNEVIEGGCYW